MVKKTNTFEPVEDTRNDDNDEISDDEAGEDNNVSSYKGDRISNQELPITTKLSRYGVSKL